MGTRADFYVGRGEQAEWIGSIAWDGYPENVDLRNALIQVTEKGFRQAVEKLSERDDFTQPEQGWPWPWKTSSTTDFAYALDGGAVWASCFGSEWWRASEKAPEEPAHKQATFPDMTKRQNVTLGKRSGVLVFGAKS